MEIFVESFMWALASLWVAGSFVLAFLGIMELITLALTWNDKSLTSAEATASESVASSVQTKENQC